MVNKDTNELNNHYFSFDLGRAHIISYSAEFYYFTQYGWDQIKRQYEWLEKDLKQANENRAKRPWIITFGHRSPYCGAKTDKECNDFIRAVLRDGIKIQNQGSPKFSIEDLFYKYGVDLEIYGHEHSYQRLFPVYKNIVYKESDNDPYNNPRAPVHLITGSAVRSSYYSLHFHLTF